MSDRRPPIDALLSYAASALHYTGLMSLGMLTALVVAQVICRDAFDIGLPWADELARFCGVALVFLSLPRLLLDNGHIAVDLVPNALAPGKRAVLARLNEALTLIFCCILLFGLYKFLLRAGKFATPAMGIPNWIYYLPAVFGIALFGLIALRRVAVRPHPRTSETGPAA